MFYKLWLPPSALDEMLRGTSSFGLQGRMVSSSYLWIVSKNKLVSYIISSGNCHLGCLSKGRGACQNLGNSGHLECKGNEMMFLQRKRA